jgi:hypothetical protein
MKPPTAHMKGMKQERDEPKRSIRNPLRPVYSAVDLIVSPTVLILLKGRPWAADAASRVVACPSLSRSVLVCLSLHSLGTSARGRANPYAVRRRYKYKFSFCRQDIQIQSTQTSLLIYHQPNSSSHMQSCPQWTAYTPYKHPIICLYHVSLYDVAFLHICILCNYLQSVFPSNIEVYHVRATHGWMSTKHSIDPA